MYRDIGLKLFCLTKIEMINCNIEDNVCQTLATLRNLEYIDFSDNGEITGKHLDKFDKLSHLNLRCCSEIQPCHIRSICKRGILKWLNIRGCDKLNSGELAEALLKLPLKSRGSKLSCTIYARNTGISRDILRNKNTWIMHHLCRYLSKIL